MAAIICPSVKTICESPFRLFVIAATGLNIPPIVTALLVITTTEDIWDGCRGPLWLAVNACLSVSNIAAAWYMSYKVSRSQDSENSSLRGRHGALSRACYMMFYDTWIAVFFTIWLGFIAWQCVGISWIEQDNCPKDVYNCVVTAVTFGWVFLAAGSMAFVLSLCCAGCDRKSYGGMKHVVMVPEAQPVPVNITKPQPQTQPQNAVVTGMPNLEVNDLELQVEATVATIPDYRPEPSAPPAPSDSIRERPKVAPKTNMKRSAWR